MFLVTEVGLQPLWIKAAAFVVYNTLVDKDFVFNLKPKQNVMKLDEIKIAIGPYMLGIVLAFVALLLEKSFNTYSQNDKMKKLVITESGDN